MNRDNLQIYQHNVNHMPTAQALLVQDLDPRTTQVIAIQEPWINPANGKTKTKKGYYPVLPRVGHPRVALLVSEELDSS
jgi:hypothetical protein